MHRVVLSRHIELYRLLYFTQFFCYGTSISNGQILTRHPVCTAWALKAVWSGCANTGHALYVWYTFKSSRFDS